MPGLLTSGELPVLEQRLRSVDSPAAASFRAAADPSDIAQVLGAAGVEPHPDVVTVFAWHDGAGEEELDGVGIGVGDTARKALVEGWHALSVREAARTRAAQLAICEETGTSDLVPPTWWPVFATLGPAYLAADTSVATDAPAPLYIVDLPGGKPDHPAGRPDFDSLSTFVAMLVRLVDEGLLTASRGSGPVIDFGRLPPELRRLATW